MAQTHPEIIIPYEHQFTSPIEQVWPLMADFGGWGKWYPAIDGMYIEGDGIDRIGCVRVIHSALTNFAYEGQVLEKDSDNYIMKYTVTYNSFTPSTFLLKKRFSIYLIL